MTQISQIGRQLGSYVPTAVVPGFDPTEPSDPDVKIPLSIIRGAADEETLTNKTLGAGSTLALNTGTTLSKLLKGTASPTIASIAAGAVSDQDVTVTGAVAGDTVIATITSAFVANMALIHWRVSAADTVTVRIRNLDGVGAIAPGVVDIAVAVLHFD